MLFGGAEDDSVASLHSGAHGRDLSLRIDRTSGNTGGDYREDHVDIQACDDVGGGYNVGWIESGEWLQYRINVEQSGTCDLRIRAARGPGGESSLRLLVDNQFETGELVIPSTGSWSAWTDVDTSVHLSEGLHSLRTKATDNAFNINYLELKLPNTEPTLTSIDDPSIAANTKTSAIAFTVGDRETALGSLEVNADSSNPTLLPSAGIAFGGSAANRTLIMTPATDQIGSAIITTTVRSSSRPCRREFFGFRHRTMP